MISEPGGPAEDERVARFERNRLDRIAPASAAEQEPRGVAERNRHDREPGRQSRHRSRPCPGAAPSGLGVVVVEDAEVGVERHPAAPAISRGQRAKVVWQRRGRQTVEVGPRRLVPVRLAVPVAAQAQHADVHLPAAADDRHIGRHGAIDERAAFVDERALPLGANSAGSGVRQGR